MILSRLLARRRIARGERPGWLAAWAPVAVDAAALLAVFALLFPVGVRLVEGQPLWSVVLGLLFVVFLPLQAVLIVSTTYAVMSRAVMPEDEATEADR